jgi:hypothetical protein
MAGANRRRAQSREVRSFVGGVYGPDTHAKRTGSLAGATLGIMQSVPLAVAIIGQALAKARSLTIKHAIKQVDTCAPAFRTILPLATAGLRLQCAAPRALPDRDRATSGSEAAKAQTNPPLVPRWPRRVAARPGGSPQRS